MPSADIPSAKELREIGRRLCNRIGVRTHGPTTAIGLRRVFDERAHVHPSRGIMLAIRACADALAEYELPREVRELRSALDAYEEASRRAASARKRLDEALRAAGPLLDEEAERRANACDAVITEDERAAGITPYIWPSPDSLRAFPRKMLELIEMEPYVVHWLHRIVRELALVDADQHVVPTFASPRVRMAKALHEDGYSNEEITTIIHPFAKGKARTSARQAVAKRLSLRSDEVVVEIPRRDSPADAVERARAAGRFVLTGQAEGLRIHVTAETDSVIAAEFPVDERLRPKRRRAAPSKPARSNRSSKTKK